MYCCAGLELRPADVRQVVVVAIAASSALSLFWIGLGVHEILDADVEIEGRELDIGESR